MQKCPSVEIRYKIVHKKEPHKWLSFYQLVAFRQLFLYFFNLPGRKLQLRAGLNCHSDLTSKSQIIQKSGPMKKIFLIGLTLCIAIATNAQTLPYSK